jgi:succinate dehydrogenase/fumarate reductase flavoprotein subunit
MAIAKGVRGFFGRSLNQERPRTLTDWERRERDERDTEAWTEAARDPDFRAENERIYAEFRSADSEAWEG